MYQYTDSKIDDDLICPVCMEPFIEPVVHSACGNTFCKRCLQLPNCPKCRVSLQQQIIPPPKIVTNMLDKLSVICPNCKQTVQRGNLEDHASLCPIPCRNGCGASVCPKNQPQHEEGECTHSVIPCTAADVGCTWKDKRLHLQKHTAECPFISQRPLLLKMQTLEEKLSKMYVLEEKLSKMQTLEEKLSNAVLEITTLKDRLHKEEQKTAALEKLVNSIKGEHKQSVTAEHNTGCSSHQWKQLLETCSKCKKVSFMLVCQYCNFRKCSRCGGGA